MNRIAALAVAALLASPVLPVEANATDALRLLARVSHMQAEAAAEDLENQNAENVRSQAEKRLETQRKDLTRNWAG